MRGLTLVLLALLLIAGITNGLIQELCATIAYIGIGVAAVALFVRRWRDRRIE